MTYSMQNFNKCTEIVRISTQLKLFQRLRRKKLPNISMRMRNASILYCVVANEENNVHQLCRYDCFEDSILRVSFHTNIRIDQKLELEVLPYYSREQSSDVQHQHLRFDCQLDLMCRVSRRPIE